MMIGHIVEAATHCAVAPVTLADIQQSAKEIARLRAELAISEARVHSLTWVLRIVRREINWGPDSPTLRLVEQSIAGAEPARQVERSPTGPMLRSL